MSSKVRTSKSRRRPVRKQDKDLPTRDQTERMLQIESTEIRGSPPVIPDIKIPLFKHAQTYTIERSYQVGVIQLSAAPLDTFGSIFFTLSSLPSSTDFTNLFDLYRIMHVKVEFIPTQQSVYSGNLITVLDYNDATVPATVSSLMQYQTVQKTNGGSTCIRSLTPRMALAAYSGAFTSYATRTLQWIDTNSSGVQHYGVKWAVQGIVAQTTADVKWIINATVICQFKNAN